LRTDAEIERQPHIPGEGLNKLAAMRTGQIFNLCGLAACLVTTPLRGVDLLTANLRVEADATLAQSPFLSWDTEGGGRANTNLLRIKRGAGLRVRTAAEWQTGDTMPTERESPRSNKVVYRIQAGTIDSH